MKNKIKKWVNKQSAALQFAMGNAQINITEQYDDAKTIGMVQKKRQGSLMDDLLAGKVTEEVKAYRSRFWFVVGHDSGGILEKINIEENTANVKGLTEPIPLNIVTKYNGINNQHAGLVDNTHNIKLTYEFTPTYNLQHYITKARVSPANDDLVFIKLDIQLIHGAMTDGINKLDLMFTKRVEKLTKEKKLDDPLFNINEISIITDEDNTFPGNININFTILNMIDITNNTNNYELTFMGKISSYSNPYDDFIQAETVDNYEKKAKREKKWIESGK